MTQATSSERVQSRRGWRWTGWLLVISLALNLLFLGLIAGAGWKSWSGDGREERLFSFSRSLEEAIQARPEGERAQLQALYERYKTEVRPLWKELRQARTEMVEALKAENFDQARAEQAVAALQSKQTEVRGKFSAITIQVMQQLSVEERKRFLNHFGSRRRSSRDRSGGS